MVIIKRCVLMLYALCLCTELASSLVIREDCNDVSEDVSDSLEIECDKSEQSDEDSEQCKVKNLFIDPNDLIKAENDDWEFDKNFSQRFEVELCENVNSSCSGGSNTRCRQRFIKIELQVVERNTKKSECKTFKIPSNCECAYFRNSTNKI